MINRRTFLGSLAGIISANAALNAEGSPSETTEPTLTATDGRCVHLQLCWKDNDTPGYEWEHRKTLFVANKECGDVWFRPISIAPRPLAVAQDEKYAFSDTEARYLATILCGTSRESYPREFDTLAAAVAHVENRAQQTIKETMSEFGLEAKIHFYREVLNNMPVIESK